MPTTNCEKNTSDIPISPSLPAPTDLVWFTLPDGTTVFRHFSVFKTGLVPMDEEYEVQPSGSTTNNIVNGESQFILSNFIGQRVRLIRGRVPQSRIARPGEYYYSFNPITAQFTVVPEPSTGEIFQIQAY